MCVSLLTGVFCVIPEGIESDSQSITRVGNDTVSPYGQLAFAFSKPLEHDKIPCLEFNPRFFSFSYQLNETLDTLFLPLSGKLDGNTRYTVHPCGELLSSSGIADSSVIYTYPCENEPNGSRNVCDTIRTEAIYGNISRSDDIDLFFVPDTMADKVYLSAYNGALCSVTLLDADGKEVSPAKGAERNLFIIPGKTLMPVHVKVSSLDLSSDGYYRIRISK